MIIVLGWLYLVTVIAVIIPFTLSLSKGAVVVRQAYHERLYYPILWRLMMLYISCFSPPDTTLV